MKLIKQTWLIKKKKYRLNEVTKIENYLNQEINQRKSCSKKLDKYVAAFDYINKVLIALSAKSSGACIISSMSVVGAPVGIAGENFPISSLTAGITKKLLSITRNNKKKHD